MRDEQSAESKKLLQGYLSITDPKAVINALPKAPHVVRKRNLSVCIFDSNIRKAQLFANFSLRESTKSKWKKLKTNLKLQMLQDSRRYLLPVSVTVYVFNRLHPISKL
jgi:hypothetical protein